jgi:RHS repeat-associated protein
MYSHSREKLALSLPKGGNPLRLVALFVGMLLAAQVASGQVVTGLPPFASLSPSSFDTVNDANLNVFFSIPVVTKAGRGMPFQYSLAYNSSVWTPLSAWSPVSNWGWGGISSAESGSVTYLLTVGECYYPQGPNGKYYYWNIYNSSTYYDPNGTFHPFSQTVSNWTSSLPCGSGAPSTATVTLNDGSGYTLTVTATPGATVYSPSGLTLNPAVGQNPGGGITDTNGNTIGVTTASGTTTFTDTLGATALTVSGSGTPSSPVSSTYTGPSDQGVVVQMNYSAYTVRTNFGCSGIGEYGPTSQNLVSSISLPDGTSYSFTYEATPGYSGDVTGRLASVTLPTGGKISYAYSGGCGSGSGIWTDGSTATLTRTVNPGGEWTYAHSENSNTWTTTITDPNLNETQITFYANSLGDDYELERKVNQGSGTLMETVDTCYNGALPPCLSSTVGYVTNRTVQITLPGLSPSKTYTAYNGYGLPILKDEYSYGPSFVRETMTCYASLSNQYIQNRPSATIVYSATGNASNCTGTSGLAAEATFTYDGAGNLKTETHTTGGTPPTIGRSFGYGTFGVLTSQTDFNGDTTSYSNFTCGSGNTAFPQTVSLPLSLSGSLAWNCYVALPASTTDANSKTTSSTYDNMLRLTETSYPDGGQTTTTYNDTQGDFNVVSKLLVTTGVNHEGTQLLDGLGRVYQSQDNSASTYVDTTYDSLGRVASVSNPYYTKSDPSYGLTIYSYDVLSRLQGASAIKRPDGNTVGITYSGNCATTTDEASKVRTICMDALGRITSVTEDPSGLDYQTTHTYDVLNDLTGVTQGSQTPCGGGMASRSFTYDSLSRLTSACTPESGTTNYYYTTSGGALCSGNPSAVCRRTDARNITTTYAYDALNRLTGKTYSDSTPPATFSYDQTSVTIGSWSSGTLSNPKGRLTEAVTTSSGTTQTGLAFSYDPVGRIKDYWQCSPQNCGSSMWSLVYNYDLAGDIQSWVHPAGFTITNTISAAQLITEISSSLVDSAHPAVLAQDMAYTAWGALSTLQNGCLPSGSCTNVQETYNYNNRLQPTRLQLGTASNNSYYNCMVYDYYGVSPTSCTSTPTQETSGNNGDVMTYWYLDNNSWLGYTATYTYDSLNRLTSAVALPAAGYHLNYTTDRYGNLACQTNGQTDGPCPNWTFNSNTNQITTAGFSYDAAGNVLADGTNTYQWDAEGREISMNSGTPGAFNALGFVGITDPAGHYIGTDPTSGWQEERIWLGDRYLAWYEPAWGNDTEFMHTNAQGTTTMELQANGTIKTDIIFYPFGQVWAYDNWDEIQFFGGMENWDWTNGLGYTPNRTYRANHGRWLSPDPLAGDVSNPQSLNRYAYVLNNPTTLIDPLGLRGEHCPVIDTNFSDGVCANLALLGASSVGSAAGVGVSITSTWQTISGDENGDPYSYQEQVDSALFGFGLDYAGTGGPAGLAALPLSVLSNQMLQSLLPCSVSGGSIDDYLQHKNSPMAGQGDAFASSGFQYSVDPRFLVALAGAESTFGQHITSGAYNAWNWFYNGPRNPAPFTSWAAGIQSVAKGISGPHYFGGGLTGTTSIYISGQYCVGPGCATGLRNLNTILKLLGGNPNEVRCR